MAAETDGELVGVTTSVDIRITSRLVTLEIQRLTIPIHKSWKILRPASRMFARYYLGSVSSGLPMHAVVRTESASGGFEYNLNDRYFYYYCRCR